MKRLFLILFLIATILFVLDTKGMLKDFKGKMEWAISPLRVLIYSGIRRPAKYWEVLKIREEAFEKMKKEEREFEACRLEADVLKKENEELRRLLQAPMPKSWGFIPARVLGKRRYLILDKGEEDGVVKEMTVVFENFLVGKVVEVSPFSSLVVTPFDSESKIAVQTEKGVRGFLEGRFGTKIFLTRVLQKETLSVKELVVTTGEGGYLPSLLIGKIKSKERESHEPFQEAEIEPLLDYGKLTTVFLVKS